MNINRRAQDPDGDWLTGLIAKRLPPPHSSLAENMLTHHI
jgi:hypothetical protein